MTSASTALLRACSLLLCLVAGSRQLSIKEFVVPKTVVVGEKAELRCQYELTSEETEAALYVKWWWTPASSSSKYDRKQIYQRIAGQSPESIHHSNSSKIEIKPNDTIVLTEVSPVDSGVYECEVSNIEEVRKHDTLMVYSLGTGPILNVSEIDDPKTESDKNALLLIECQAENVAPEPFFVVTLDKKELNMTTTVEDDDHDGLYSIYANITLPIENTDPKEVNCELFYTDETIAHPQSIATKTYVPEGYDPSTTEMPEDTTQPESTPESLQNPSDDGVRLHCSWALLVSAAVLAHLQSIL